jgi:RND superfamily putative drug exporter
VTGHPRAALISSVCMLAALAVPVLSIHTANPGDNDLPKGTPVLIAEHAIERQFPGAPATADVVVTGRRLDTESARSELRGLGRKAISITHGSGPVSLDVATDGRTAVLAVPMPDRGYTAAAATIDALRRHVDTQAARVAPGARGQITGDAAFNVDFSSQMSTVTPLVIAFVLALAFALLAAAFRSPALAASVIGLNLLSVGAAFGVLVAIFQHHWAQSLLGFTSDGTIVSWLPLFAFVVLFGLSMDYTVLMLERVREARLKGADARTAAQEALTTTGSTVTSAAVVMVAVFAIFALLRLLEFKQLGVGLAAAIALDATIVRGVALPAALTLLGDKRGIRVRKPTLPARVQTEHHPTTMVAFTSD